MSDLTDFLLERIAEDEEVARAGISGQADPENGWGYEGRVLTPHVGIIHEPVQAAHITRWHPYRVLAECEAKRQVVEDYEYAAKDYRVSRTPLGEGRRFAALMAVARMAAVYSDHPDYRDEWRP